MKFEDRVTELSERIRTLSLRDTKTLSQKGLKASEEVGELAKAILPFEGAHGTNHRCPNEDKVFEECADTLLVVLSIMHSMGKSDEDIVNELSRKTDYWQFLIENEDKADLSSLDFEIHITVKEAEVEPFMEDCSAIGVKPIILDLYTDGGPIKDVMTSSRFRGSTMEVMRHTKDLANEIRDLGYEVVREKIETVPWHPAAMVHAPKQSAYFEAHIAFTPDERLRAFAELHDVHMSRNAMKKGADVVAMGTYRVSADLTSPEKFKTMVEKICKSAELVGLKVRSRPHVEYSLWDTNEQHDKAWINGAS